MATFANVDEYIASFPVDVRARLEDVRATMRAAAPGTEERISYGIPTFALEGRYVVYFAGWKDHVSVYPVPGDDPALEQEMAPYVAGKGTLRFPNENPIPHDLVRRVVQRLMDRRHAAGE
jgi:uncharacterized protein YdhG (YjbR/CyaY superfamily)